MSEQNCPLLGTRVDRNTHFTYPSRENQCNAHNRVSPLTLEEQETLCLGPAYPTCRFFLAHQSRELATHKAEESLTRVSTPDPPYRPSRLTIAGVAIAAILICGALLVVAGLPQSIATAIIPTATPTVTRVPTRTLTPTACASDGYAAPADTHGHRDPYDSAHGNARCLRGSTRRHPRSHCRQVRCDGAGHHGCQRHYRSAGSPRRHAPDHSGWSGSSTQPYPQMTARQAH